MIARLNPPEMIGISMAKVSNPSSGSWNAIEPKLASVRNCGEAIPKTTTTASRKATSPTTSAPEVLFSRAMSAPMLAPPAIAARGLAELDVRRRNGDQDDRAHHHLEGKGRHAQKVQSVLR